MSTNISRVQKAGATYPNLKAKKQVKTQLQSH